MVHQQQYQWYYQLQTLGTNANKVEEIKVQSPMRKSLAAIMLLLMNLHMHIAIILWM
jgi:hypothetical protein